MKVWGLVMAVVCVQVGVTGPAWAQAENGAPSPPAVNGQASGVPSLAGRFGIGAAGFITATPSAQGTYWVTEMIGVVANLQVRYLDPDDENVDSSTLFLLGAGVLINLIESDRVRLEGLASAALGLGDASGVAIGLGLRPEYFLSDSFSVHLQVGVLIGVDYNPGPGDVDATLIDIGAGSLVGDAGFTFYF